MAFGSERSVLVHNSIKRTFVNWVGDLHYGRVLRYLYLARLLDSLNLEPKNILDAGCDRGFNTYYLAQRYPNARVVGVDVNTAAVEKAKQIRDLNGVGNIEYGVHDLEQPLHWNHLDLALLWGVLECIPNDTQALTNIYSVLEKGGVCLIFAMHATGAYQRIGARKLIPFEPESAENWKGTGAVRPGYRETEIKNLLEQIGYTSVTVRPTFGPLGMFSHSWFEMGNKWALPFYLALFPILVGLGQIDSRMHPRKGGGILAMGWKG